MGAPWNLVLWWCWLIVGGELLPESGWRVWTCLGELGHTEALEPMRGAMIRWDSCLEDDRVVVTG